MSNWSKTSKEFDEQFGFMFRIRKAGKNSLKAFLKQKIREGMEEIVLEKRSGNKLEEYKRALDSWVKALDEEEYKTGPARASAEHNARELVKMVNSEMMGYAIEQAYNKAIDEAEQKIAEWFEEDK